jgi:hypothetical protein
MKLQVTKVPLFATLNKKISNKELEKNLEAAFSKRENK